MKYLQTGGFRNHPLMRLTLGGTLVLIALAILLWADGLLSLELMTVLDFYPLDVYRLRNLLILIALLAAAGKALILTWLTGGGVGAFVIFFILFKMMGK